MMRWIVGTSLKLRFLVVVGASLMMFFGVAQFRNLSSEHSVLIDDSLGRPRAPAGEDDRRWICRTRRRDLEAGLYR